MRGQLHKVILNKNKNSFLETEFNYYFYIDLFKFFKFLSKRSVYRNYIKSQENILIFSPTYTYKSQCFSNKSLFNDILVNFKLKGFFLYRNFFKNAGYKSNSYIFKNRIIGYNFYIFNKVFKNDVILNRILNYTDDKDYNGIGKIKTVLKNNYNCDLKNELNIFFNFNIYCFNILEIYKIIMFVYIVKI